MESQLVEATPNKRAHFLRRDMYAYENRTRYY